MGHIIIIKESVYQQARTTLNMCVPNKSFKAFETKPIGLKEDRDIHNYNWGFQDLLSITIYRTSKEKH